MNHGETTGRSGEAFQPISTGGESWVAIEVRDSLHDAVASVLAGGETQWVELRSLVLTLLRYDITIAHPIARGIYLATWGRPVVGQLVMGTSGTGIHVSPRSV